MQQVCAGSLRSLLYRLAQIEARGFSSASNLKNLSLAAPGTVSLYEKHLFIEEVGHTAADWPASVERTPAVLRAFAAVAKHKASIPGTVKVTAFASQQRFQSGEDACNAMLFPDGLLFANIQPKDLDSVIANHVVDVPQPPLSHGGSVQEVSGIHLFVCCHAARDARCGKFGPQLARRLLTLVREQGLSKHVHVYQCSHVGGHKFAANVLVYGAISPNDGDWFGGLSADDAERFLMALTQIEFGSEGGFDHPTLRQWWRGRMGLTKDEQKASFEQRCLCMDMSEDEDGDFDGIAGFK